MLDALLSWGCTMVLREVLRSGGENVDSGGQLLGVTGETSHRRENEERPDSIISIILS